VDPWCSRCVTSYSVCASTELCGIPALISLGVDNSPSTETLNFLLVRYKLMSFIKFVGNCNFDILYGRPECHVVSKAFSMSKNTAAVDILLLKFRVIWSVSLMHWGTLGLLYIFPSVPCAFVRAGVLENKLQVSPYATWYGVWWRIVIADMTRRHHTWLLSGRFS
jgi:hypothetical protein